MRRGTEFSAAIRGGARGGAQRLVVHLRTPRGDADQSPDGGSARVGLIVPRTVGSAVQRNRVKRRLRALLADVLADIPPRSELVVRALPAAGQATSAELSNDLRLALSRARRRSHRVARKV